MCCRRVIVLIHLNFTNLPRVTPALLAGGNRILRTVSLTHQTVRSLPLMFIGLLWKRYMCAYSRPMTLPEVGRVDLRRVENDGTKGRRHGKLADHRQRHAEYRQVVTACCRRTASPDYNNSDNVYSPD